MRPHYSFIIFIISFFKTGEEKQEEEEASIKKSRTNGDDANQNKDVRQQQSFCAFAFNKTAEALQRKLGLAAISPSALPLRCRLKVKRSFDFDPFKETNNDTTALLKAGQTPYDFRMFVDWNMNPKRRKEGKHMSIILIDEEQDLQIIDSDQQQCELRASLQEQATMHLIRTLNDSPYDCKLKHTPKHRSLCVCMYYIYIYIYIYIYSHS